MYASFLGGRKLQLAEGAIEGSTFNAARQKWLRDFDQIAFRFGCGAALRRDIERRA
jgi:hypothetical protein